MFNYSKYGSADGWGCGWFHGGGKDKRDVSCFSALYILYFQQVFPFSLRAGIELGERSLGGDTEEIILVVVVLPYQPC